MPAFEVTVETAVKNLKRHGGIKAKVLLCENYLISETNVYNLGARMC